MEEGQKIDINLESPLDTKSSDMLVSVQDVKFAHNRQKFQGHVLPTSLRYERNGWAAGWYVYDFKMGGGYIFSKNEVPVIEGGEWLAANRSKINNTPTYVLSFYTARNDNDADTPDNRTELKQYADAVRDIQFQAWFTDTASINARECEEAEISFMPVPELSFNYAVDNYDYKNVIRFTPFQNLVVNDSPAGVQFDPDNCFETLSPDAQHSADLSMEYVSRAADGTVTAILNNNEVRWIWDDDIYVPKDLVDEEGNKFAKFINVTDKVVNWKLGSETLQYDDVQNKFIYNEVTHDPDTDLEVTYAIPVTYTIPFSKYYSTLNNITWSIQGTNILFNNEDTNDPVNVYKISTDHISSNTVNVFDGTLSRDGFDGPDVSIVSQLKLPLSNLPDNTVQSDFNTNADAAASQNYIADGTPCIVPMFNAYVKSFKLSDNDEARDVMLQLYYKYPGRHLLNVGTVNNRPLRAVAMSYQHAAVGKQNEVVYGSTNQADTFAEYTKYNIDNKQLQNKEDGLSIGSKLLWGRQAELNISITGLNGVTLDTPINVQSGGINCNMIFDRMTETNRLVHVDNTDYSQSGGEPGNPSANNPASWDGNIHHPWVGFYFHPCKAYKDSNDLGSNPYTGYTGFIKPYNNYTGRNTPRHWDTMNGSVHACCDRIGNEWHFYTRRVGTYTALEYNESGSPNTTTTYECPCVINGFYVHRNTASLDVADGCNHAVFYIPILSLNASNIHLASRNDEYYKPHSIIILFAIHTSPEITTVNGMLTPALGFTFASELATFAYRCPEDPSLYFTGSDDNNPNHTTGTEVEPQINDGNEGDDTGDDSTIHEGPGLAGGQLINSSRIIWDLPLFQTYEDDTKETQNVVDEFGYHKEGESDGGNWYHPASRVYFDMDNINRGDLQKFPFYNLSSFGYTIDIVAINLNTLLNRAPGDTVTDNIRTWHTIQCYMHVKAPSDFYTLGLVHMMPIETITTEFGIGDRKADPFTLAYPDITVDPAINDNSVREKFFDQGTDCLNGIFYISPEAIGHDSSTEIANETGRFPWYWFNTPDVATRPVVFQNNKYYLYTASGLYTFDKSQEDYWIDAVNGIAEIAGNNLVDYICMDIMDVNTGELLVDHRINTVQVSQASYYKIDLSRSKLLKGRVFFNDTTEDSPAWKQALYNKPLHEIYRDTRLSGAFFPVCNYRINDTHSVYRESSEFGGCQGIVLFNTVGTSGNLPANYNIVLLSPLSSYILPPRVDLDNDYVVVYAGKTYTHHIKFNTDIEIFNYKFIDDNCTDVNAIDVTYRQDLYSDSNVAIESNNKYYMEGSVFITPASIAYYNKQMHITYKAAAGTSVLINNSLHDISTSDLSIKQTADLVPVYLLKYTDAANRYNFVIGDHDNVLLTKDTKEIINTIADTKKHWVDVTIQAIDFSQELPQVSLSIKEYHDNDNNESNNSNLTPLFERILTYDSTLQYTEAFVDTEFSDDSQVIVNSEVNGITTIALPDMPSGSVFGYNIADGVLNVIDSQDSSNHFKYDYNSNTVLEMFIKGKELAKANTKLVAVDSSAAAYNVYTIAVNQNINTLVYFKHYGIYKFASLTTGTITPLVKELQYNPQNKREVNIKVSDLVYVGRAEPTPVGINEQYTLDFSHFDDKTECTPKFLDFSATDVRNDNPDTQTKQFARVMADNEYQLIKQHWDSTVKTECFWWIDESRTLELTKDRFILKAKVTDGNYDDWMGDKWEVIYELPRTDYLTSEADTYICSSATGRNARGYLYILQPVTDISIKVTIYDPLDNMSVVLERTITFKHVELGTAKRHALLNAVNDYSSEDYVVGTYSDIVSSSLLADSKLSAVCIKGVHWLGIQYDKNFNQWSFAFGSDQRIIQGYGCIGINGFATGGMIPAKYFNGTGFSDTVYNINELEAEEDQTLTSLDKLNIFKERVVGDENQQWYISEELNDIVMAVDLINDNVIKLPITNKYSQVYSSPSYVKYTVHALGIQIKQLLNLFGDDDNAIWKEIIKYAMFPLVWYLSPYTNIINYLQQTLGQYAYVHYNSTSIGKQSSKLHTESTEDNSGLSENEASNHIDALITDDLSFDVMHIPQEQSFKDNAWDNVLGIFASMVVSATDYAMKDLTVNSLQNQSAVSDIGKKFSQSFLQNIGSMSVTGFNMQSTKPMLKSEVTAVKTLDMFYSTSAQQNCYAGPGFVNMQFVAQCTAQSVTSVQLEAQQTQVFILLRQLTTWQGKATIFILDLLKDFMFKMSDNMSGGPSAGVVVGLGWIGALVTSAIGYALVAAKALVKLGIETVDSMLDSFFSEGIKTNVTAQLSRHNYDIEGKHAYGNKSECFMWPCADAKSKLYTDESVEAVLQDKSWPLEMPKATTGNMQFKPIYSDQPKCFTITPALLNSNDWDGQVPYSIAMCKGSQKRRALPDSTAFVIGSESFMPTVPFKNENIGEGEPVFTPPPVQDYIIDKNWNLFVTAMAGDALWVSCKDTKLFDGNYSNIVVTDSFCGIAAPHVAVEIKRNICEEYLRPWAVSPDAIALNITGLNCAYEEVAYHAFDGYGYRITDWLGSSGMNKEHYTLQYCFQINDRFKRSNKLPPNQFMGNFQAVPSMSLDIKDKIFNDIQVTTEERGLRTGVAGENKDTQRYSLPIFTEQISSLPAIVRALSPYKLAVIDGITSLTTDVRISQSVYKIPDSIDFNINDKLYRMTNEYICSVDHQKGLEVVKYLVPALGLTYLGATPFMAYFYNQATRQYYIYQGGNTLQVMDMLERFRDIKSGTYDFINQEVVMPCLATMSRLDKKVKDDADETDNIVIPVFRHNKVGGELTPPITTIFNTESWYRTVSIPAGLVFQGPNRCIINRFIWSQYMLKDIKANKGKWKKVPREEYHPFREYSQHYETMPRRIASDAVKGWTHNPFLLVTAPLGVNEETDCKFEWEITFAWTTEMEQLYEHDEYVTVNVMAETMAPGGKVFSRPTHIFLHKELFTRTGNYGYYSFRYQSNCGAGNRERLHIWSDGYIAVSSLQLEYKVISSKRSEQLVTQEDIKGMKEM